MSEKRYYVHDTKVSPLQTFSAMNPRYWVIDRTTNLPVDDGTTKRSAQMGADLLNSQA